MTSTKSKKQTTLQQALADHPFFQGLKKEYIHLLAAQASLVAFDPGQHIFREGEVADQFYALQEGQVMLDTFVPNHGLRTIQVINAGEILGWSWFVPPHRWRFNALTVAPVQAILLDGKYLRAKFEEDRVFGYEMVKRLAVVIGRRFTATRVQL